jgi:hypothetical protein
MSGREKCGALLDARGDLRWDFAGILNGALPGCVILRRVRNVWTATATRGGRRIFIPRLSFLIPCFTETRPAP